MVRGWERLAAPQENESDKRAKERLKDKERVEEKGRITLAKTEKT